MPRNPLEPWFAEGLDEEGAWVGFRPGPSVAELTERLSTAPKPFLAERIDLVALAGDVLPRSSAVPRAAERIVATGSTASVTGAALGLWLLASHDLVGPLSTPLVPLLPERPLLALGLRLAPVVAPERWLVEAERREEAVRTLLLWCGQLPAGEDAGRARALYDQRDSVRREKALGKALKDHAHRLQVLRELQAQRAREAAARYSHE